MKSISSCGHLTCVWFHINASSKKVVCSVNSKDGCPLPCNFVKIECHLLTTFPRIGWHCDLKCCLQTLWPYYVAEQRCGAETDAQCCESKHTCNRSWLGSYRNVGKSIVTCLTVTKDLPNSDYPTLLQPYSVISTAQDQQLQI